LIKKITKSEIKDLKSQKDVLEELEELQDKLEKEINLREEAEKVVDSSFIWDVDKIAEGILTFGAMLAKVQFYPYQEEAALGLVKSLLTLDERAEAGGMGDIITIHFPRQSGKTEIFKVVVPACAVLLPMLSNKFPEKLAAYRNGFYAGVFALSKETSSTMFEKIQGVFKASEAQPLLAEAGVKVGKTNPINLSNGSILRQHSLLAKILVSQSYHLMIIDEADKALDTHRLTTDIQPMGTAYNGTFVMLGTAGDQPCLFYNYIQSNRRDIKNGGIKKHFQITWKEAQKVNVGYAAAMRKVLQDLEDGNITLKSFKMSYELKWLIDDNRFISIDAFNEMLDKDSYLVENGNDKLIKGSTLVAGLDLAKKIDRTVFTLMKLEPITGSDRVIRRIVFWHEIQKKKWTHQKKILYEVITRFSGLTTLYADATGKGDVFVDDLEEELEDWDVEIIPFIFSDKSKAEGYAKLEDVVERRELIIPGEYTSKQTNEFKHFQEDLQASQKVHKKIYTLVEATPPAHDDYTDSLMLANMAAEDYLQYGDINISQGWSNNDSGGYEWEVIS